MDVPSTAVAHVALDADGAWRVPHDLAEHLRSVGALASEFAAHYGAGWARLAGRWHDLGKYRPRFQRYIRQASGFEANAHITGETGKAPHSTTGRSRPWVVLETGRVEIAPSSGPP